MQKMFFTEFGSLLDIYTWHFISAVGVSVLAVTVTFFLSKRSIKGVKNTHNKICMDKKLDEGKESADDEMNDSETDMKRGLKKSPAVMAEMVIKANMTEEQRTLELQVRKKQLTEICKLMQKESQKFGEISINEVEEQMKLYQ